MTAILDRKVTGIKQSVGQNNCGKFTGTILLDLFTDEVTFNIVDAGYYKAPGVVELHSTSNLYISKTSIKALKAAITAHYLTIQGSGLDPEEYARELTWAGTGLGPGDELMQTFRNHLASLTSEVM